jgi:hypothetical protein
LNPEEEYAQSENKGSHVGGFGSIVGSSEELSKLKKFGSKNRCVGFFQNPNQDNGALCHVD